MTPASVRAPLVRATVPAVDAELAADALWAAGAAGVEERIEDAPPGQVVLVAGPHAGGDAGPLLAAVVDRWPAELLEADLGAALDAWRVHARSVRVGRLVVRPPRIDPVATDEARPAESDHVELVVDPGRAFGSGAHASTRVALELLADLIRAGDRVLDLGCGSGVLSVAAGRLGAGAVVAIDLDPEAVEATLANAMRNGVADVVTVVEADASAEVPDVVPGPFDVVVANMLLPDLQAAAPVVARALAPDGTAVLAGLLDDQRARALAAYRSVGLVPAGDPRCEGEWIGLVLEPRPRTRDASGGDHPRA